MFRPLITRNLYSLFLLLLCNISLPAQEFRPNLGPDLPGVTVNCGDVTVLLRQSSQWTPGRFDYRGIPMTTEKSAYGTVFNFPGVGFIGTAHLENEPEELQSLQFLLDGKIIKQPTAELTGDSFRLERHSQIRDFDLTNIVEIRNNRIYETAEVRANEDVPLKLVYHFMHAWRPSISELMGGIDEMPEEQITQTLRDGDEVTKVFYLNQPVDWMAVYEADEKLLAVSRVLQTPEQVQGESRLWNVPGVYRKYYHVSFSGQTVPKGFDGTWKMVTSFARSEPNNWQQAARELARELNESEK